MTVRTPILWVLAVLPFVVPSAALRSRCPGHSASATQQTSLDEEQRRAHQPWMDDMREHGVKLALFTFEFDWTDHGAVLTNWKCASAQYFGAYSYSKGSSITSPAQLAAIRSSGLEAKLEEVALERAKKGVWFEAPAQQDGTEYRSITLADSTWFPDGLFFAPYEPGTTLLTHAALRGDLSKIDELVHEGVDVNALNADGSTALTWAASGGKSAAVQALLRAGATVRGKQERSNALIAAIAGDSTETVEILLKAGANPNSRTVDGESALSMARRRHDDAIVQLLVKAGAHP